MDEITSMWTKYRFHMFEVVDDEFNVPQGNAKGVGPEHPKEFCKGVLEMKGAGRIPKELQWRCPNGLRADYYDAELNDLLLQSGCGQVSFGVESLHPEVFKKVMKGETVEEIEATLRLCGERGMPFFAHTIIGLPGSDFETDIYTLNRLMDITDGGRLGFGTFSILQVMAGSPMAAIAQREGYRDPSFVDYAFFGDNVKVTYWTDGYGKEDRLDAYLITNYCMGNGRVPEYYRSRSPEEARADLVPRIERHARELRSGLGSKWHGRLGL